MDHRNRTFLGIVAIVTAWALWQTPIVRGQTEPPPGTKSYLTPSYLTYENVANVTCGAASGVLSAAQSFRTETVLLVPAGADTGVRIAFAAAAGATSPLIGPGQAIILSGKQQIRCIRAGAADVAVGILRGTQTP